MLDQIKTFITTKLNFFVHNYLENKPKTEELKSKLDSAKVLEILLVKYSNNIFDSLEEELHAVYTECKNYSLTLKEHTKEHHKVINMLQNINKDLEKIEVERLLINKSGEVTMQKIKQDIGITTYKITRQKKND